MEAGGEGERVGERLEEKLGKLENTSTLQKIIQISHEIGKSTRAIGDKLWTYWNTILRRVFREF